MRKLFILVLSVIALMLAGCSSDMPVDSADYENSESYEREESAEESFISEYGLPDDYIKETKELADQKAEEYKYIFTDPATGDSVEPEFVYLGIYYARDLEPEVFEGEYDFRDAIFVFYEVKAKEMGESFYMVIERMIYDDVYPEYGLPGELYMYGLFDTVDEAKEATINKEWLSAEQLQL